MNSSSTRPPERVTLRRSLIAVLACAYAPYAWLLGMDYPWSEYRWHWFKMWPILPGFVLRSFLPRHSSEVAGLAIMATATALVLGLAIWSGRRSRRALLVTSVVLLAASLLNSWISYQLFRA